MSRRSPFLSDNREYFESATKAAMLAAQSGDVEQAMAWANVAGDCGWNMHPGFFTHPALEAMLHALGNKVKLGAGYDGLHLPPRRDSVKSWLHILTTAMDVGGHTRLVERMIKNTALVNNDRHSILLIDQGDINPPPWLQKAAESTGGTLLRIPAGYGFHERARIVRRIAYESADRVMLHIHPNDPVASVAFAQAEGPPVAFLNHADHVFWLGTECSDLVVDIRPEGLQLTHSRRINVLQTVVPIPLEPSKQAMTKVKARQMLGIADNEVVLLSIASSYKFAPLGDLDFTSMAASVLQRHPQALMIVVGPSSSEDCWQNAIEKSGGRLRLAGVQKDIEAYYAAADIYLESYPLGSLTSALDAILRGIPVIRAPHAIPPILRITKYDGINEAATDDEMYLEQVAVYISNPVERRLAGEQQHQAVIDAHTGVGWLDEWQKFVQSIPAGRLQNPARSMDQWDVTDNYDHMWATLQERQAIVKPARKLHFNNRIHKNLHGRSRKEIFSIWRKAIMCGNWKIAKVLVRDLMHWNN